MTIDFPTIVPKFDTFLARGLCSGVGTREGQMCIEAAICAAMDLPHGDDPICVTPAVRSFKISLNDSPWSSPEARAKGLRSLGIAQIGSRGVVDDYQFISRLTEKIIKQLLPDLFRRGAARFKLPELAVVANECEKTGSRNSAARAAREAEAARAAWAAEAAEAAREAERHYKEFSPDYYLLLVARLAHEVLLDLKSPGALWLQEQEDVSSLNGR